VGYSRLVGTRGRGDLYATKMGREENTMKESRTNGTARAKGAYRIRDAKHERVCGGEAEARTWTCMFALESTMLTRHG
jgi:hypothetical protein